MRQDFNHLFIITHTDLDGIGSAAAAVVASGRSSTDYTVLYAEPYNLHEVLRDIISHVEGGDLLVIADLGPNKDSFEESLSLLKSAAEKGVFIEWYDHHIWLESEIEAAKRAGVDIVVDRSTCATGVVAKYMPDKRGIEPPSFLFELVKAVCAADLWVWDHPLAPKLFRVADSRYEEGKEAWRNKLVEKFVNGVMWDEELEKMLEEYVNLELENYSKILKTVYVEGPPCRVVAVYKERGPPSNSIIGASLLSRFNSDIAVILRSNGGISLRSRNVDVQQVARELGGGGHPRAAGAKIKIGALSRITSLVLGKRRLARDAAKRVRRTALRLGVCG